MDISNINPDDLSPDQTKELAKQLTSSNRSIVDQFGLMLTNDAVDKVLDNEALYSEIYKPLIKRATKGVKQNETDLATIDRVLMDRAIGEVAANNGQLSNLLSSIGSLSNVSANGTAFASGFLNQSGPTSTRPRNGEPPTSATVFAELPDASTMSGMPTADAGSGVLPNGGTPTSIQDTSEVVAGIIPTIQQIAGETSTTSSGTAGETGETIAVNKKRVCIGGQGQIVPCPPSIVIDIGGMPQDGGSGTTVDQTGGSCQVDPNPIVGNYYFSRGSAGWIGTGSSPPQGLILSDGGCGVKPGYQTVFQYSLPGYMKPIGCSPIINCGQQQPPKPMPAPQPQPMPSPIPIPSCQDLMDRLRLNLTVECKDLPNELKKHLEQCGYLVCQEPKIIDPGDTRIGGSIYSELEPIEEKLIGETF